VGDARSKCELVSPLGGGKIFIGMSSSLAIGDFSRATHLNIKALRHYHRIGLLEPAEVDPFTGHRRYTTEQIPTAQVIRRFRTLDMPLEEIHAVINTADPEKRNELIAAHLQRLELTLARTQRAAASLRDLSFRCWC
jgi:DNA-binding transcriptional MerR regulator